LQSPFGRQRKIGCNSAAERHSREAAKTNYPEMLRVLDEIRTFFQQNPDWDFD